MPTAHNDTTTSRLLSINEAAERLNVHRRTIERLTYAGKLPRVKIGRAVRIPLSAVADYLDSATETPNMSTREREQVLAAQRADLMGGEAE